MTGVNLSNLDQIANDLLINRTDDGDDSIKLLDAFIEESDVDTVAKVLNYCFEISNNSKVIDFILKKINKFKLVSSVSSLVDALVLKEKYKNKITDSDLQTQIRINITKVLANLKDTSAVNALLYCLNNKDENYKLRLSCAEALGKIGDKYAVTPLSDLLQDDSESSVYVKESAAFALGMIGDMKAVESLVSILETKKGIIDKFTFLKERAIEALGKINSKSDRVFAALMRALKDESPQVRINAIEALSNIDNPHVSDILKDMLSDKSDEVVRNAIIALFNICGESVLYDILNNPTSSLSAVRQVREVIKEIEECEEEDS